MRTKILIVLLLTGMNFLVHVTLGQNNAIVSKYDFIPGEKVIFYDDFTSENLGDFPAQWLTNGSGEIVTSQRYPGRWFQITKGGYFIPEVGESFTENYTVEFDLVPMNTISNETLMGTSFFLLSGTLTEPGGGGEPGRAGLVLSPDYDNLFWKNWSEASDRRDNGSVSFTFRTNEKYHLSLWVQKQRVRLYANENKVLDLPRGLQAGFQYNIFRIDTRDEAIPIIGNFRIASGSSDMRSRLLKDGKIVSYGITFDINSDKLRPESLATLQEVANILKETPELRIQIVGHTDSDGDEAFNVDLSRRRSISAKRELVQTFGIAASRLDTDGKGESEPLAANTSAVNKAKNRRVELIRVQSAAKATTFTDLRDGKVYRTVGIGSQTWLAENLAFKADKGCFAYGNSDANAKLYGYLYTWESAMKACPSGWHLPTEKEWNALTVQLGGDSLAHLRMKEVGKAHWMDEDPLATNESGFTALPGGVFSNMATRGIEFQYLGHYGYWWSATTSAEPNMELNAWFRVMGDNFRNEAMDTASKSRGSSVRCIKDP